MNPFSAASIRGFGRGLYQTFSSRPKTTLNGDRHFIGVSIRAMHSILTLTTLSRCFRRSLDLRMCSSMFSGMGSHSSMKTKGPNHALHPLLGNPQVAWNQKHLR